MLQRVLEPEVMDTVADATDYDAMDHSTVNRLFVDDLLAARALLTNAPARWCVFDAGTGTALIPLELAARDPRVLIVAADAAETMLTLAREHVARAGLNHRISPVRRDCKALPEADESFDVVMSNSIVHHIPEPASVLHECWRILKPGGLLFVRDLLRPVDDATVTRLVETYAAGANEHQRKLFDDSLRAALTVEEVRELIAPWGLPPDVVQATSDRHWTLCAWKS